MKSGGGKAKGSGYEREICRFLTKWVSGVETPYVFYRSPSSGAVSTITRSDNISGDIISVKNEGDFLLNLFSIEVKTGYPQADFFQHFKDTKRDIIKDFWIQCQTDAKKSNKYGMLIFKKKGLKPIVGICNNMQSILNDMVDLHLINSIQIRFFDETPSVVFYDMELFFNNVKPEMIKSI